MSHRVASELAHMPRLVQDVSVDEQDAVIAEILEKALDEGRASVQRGPELLPVLKEAGVVDAGGFGLTILIAGIVAALRGTDPGDIDFSEIDGLKPARVTHPQHESSTYRYCTNFAVTGKGLNSSDWIDRLEQIGDSVLVVGDHTTLRVHIHTDHPEQVTSLFGSAGKVSRLDVADMDAQTLAREKRLSNGYKKCGVLALVTSDGLAELFRSMGATPLDGGSTLNPSTYELLAGIHGIHAEEVVVLPNSPNVIMTAERAAELSEKKVRVVPSRTQQAGLAAAVVLDSAKNAKKNAEAMVAVLGEIRTGAVTRAARADSEGRFSVGDAIGIIGEEVVSWGEPAAALSHVLNALGESSELLTLIAGEKAPLDLEAVSSLAPGDVEVEYLYGGQPHYWWLITAE
jgi:dihydroxyacetone kinase-like predicted kinase